MTVAAPRLPSPTCAASARPYRAGLLALAALAAALAVGWPGLGAEPLALIGEREELQAFPITSGLPIDGWMVLGPLTEPAAPEGAPPGYGVPQGKPEVDWRSPVWIGAEPYLWTPMLADAASRFHPRAAAGPVARGDVVYLCRVVRTPRETQATLALTGRGGVTAWCNGARLDPAAEGSDRERFLRTPLVRGPNVLLVRHEAPVVGEPWSLMARFVDAPTTTSAPPAPLLPARQVLLVGQTPPLPAGWKHQQAAVATAKGRNHPYLLYAPARPDAPKPDGKDRASAKPPAPSLAPLLIVALPAEPSEERTLLYEDRLTTAACQTGWAVAVLVEPAAGSAGYGTAEAIEAVRRDVLARVTPAPRRVALVALGDAAEDALAAALAQPGVYAGIGVLEGRWRDQESWTHAVMGCAPRPVIYLAAAPGATGDPLEEVQAELAPEDGAWVRRTIEPGKESLVTRDLLAAFRAAPMTEAPARIVLSGFAPPPRRFGWIRLERPLDAAQTAFLSAELATTNSLNVQAENVARFDLSWKTLPAVNPLRPITLVVDSPDGQQKVNLLGPKLPPVLALSLLQKNEQTVVWEARDAESLAKATPRAGEPKLENASPVKLPADLAAWSDYNRAGLAQWLARAAREAGGAAVGIVPARMARCGRVQGELALSDWAVCSFDARLSTTTLPADFVLRLAESDFAGPRLLATDGIAAVADEEERRDRVFAASALEARGQSPIVVAGTHSLIDRIVNLRQNAVAAASTPSSPAGRKPTPSPTPKGAPAATPPAPAAPPVYELLGSQREAFLRYLQTHPAPDRSGPPDLRCPPRKMAPEAKRKTQKTAQ